MQKYPYIIPQSGIYKPLIPVMLSFKKTHKTTPRMYALLDTGADVCFCSDDIAFWLGSKDVKSKEHKEFTAADGKKFNSYKDEFTLLGAGTSYNCPFYISKSLPKSTPIILGQIGFFDHFKVTFDVRKNEIIID